MSVANVSERLLTSAQRTFNALAGEKMKSSKKIALVMAIALTGSIVSASQTLANDPCFAAIPDSAWANGEPAEVTAALNFDLVGTKTAPEEIFFKSVFGFYYYPGFLTTFLLNPNQVATKYSYIGKNCSTRVVVVKGGSKPVPIVSIEELKDFFQKNSANFAVADVASKSIDTLVSKIAGKTIKVSVDSKLTSKPRWEYVNALRSLIPDKELTSLTGALKTKDAALAASVFIKFDPKCMQITNRSPVFQIPDEVKLYGLVLPSRSYPQSLKFTSKKVSCKSEVYIGYGGGPFGSDPIAAPVGTLTFKPA